jgi:hypothetical protein
MEKIKALLVLFAELANGVTNSQTSAYNTVFPTPAVQLLEKIFGIQVLVTQPVSVRSNNGNVKRPRFRRR